MNKDTAVTLAILGTLAMAFSVMNPVWHFPAGKNDLPAFDLYLSPFMTGAFCLRTLWAVFD